MPDVRRTLPVSRGRQADRSCRTAPPRRDPSGSARTGSKTAPRGSSPYWPWDRTRWRPRAVTPVGNPDPRTAPVRRVADCADQAGERAMAVPPLHRAARCHAAPVSPGRVSSRPLPPARRMRTPRLPTQQLHRDGASHRAYRRRRRAPAANAAQTVAVPVPKRARSGGREDCRERGPLRRGRAGRMRRRGL